jgi:hypothetical protein
MTEKERFERHFKANCYVYIPGLVVRPHIQEFQTGQKLDVALKQEVRFALLVGRSAAGLRRGYFHQAAKAKDTHVTVLSSSSFRTGAVLTNLAPLLMRSNYCHTSFSKTRLEISA